MNILDKLFERLTGYGVTLEELDDKTKRKYKKLKDILTSKLKTLRNPETGQFTDNMKTQITDLVEDILAEAKVTAKRKTDTAPPPIDTAPKPGDPTNDSKPGDPPKGDPKPKKSTFFGWLLGED
jgi:hypothetical protein